VLYKYRSFDDHKFKQIFEEGSLYFSRPEQFNDPFESKPKLIGLDTLEEKRRYIESHVQRYYEHLGYMKRKELKREFLIQLSDPKVTLDKVHEVINKNGVLCLSKRWDKTLMWSHYAKSHTGICIGIDFSNYKNDDFGFYHDVIYSQNYPSINFELFGSEHDEALTKLLQQTMQTKSNEWSYEEEVRFIKFRAQGGAGVYPFNKNKISEIILGARISPVNCEEILKLTKLHVPNARIFQTKLSDTSYSIERTEIPKV
jgi:hypothetical protein